MSPPPLRYRSLTRLLCTFFVGSGKKYHRLFTHYGRTDDLENDPNSGRKETRHYANLEQTEAGYESIIEEKTGKKGYRKVDMASGNIGSDKARARHAEPAAADEEEEAQASSSSSGLSSSLHPMVQSLINYIYAEATSRLTATVSAKITSRGIETPLGVLTLTQVEKGEAILDELQTLYETNKLDQASAERLSSDFYTVIPHPIGRSKMAVMAAVLKTPEAFEQKRELLQLMKDMVQVNSAGGGVLHRYYSPTTHPLLLLLLYRSLKRAPCPLMIHQSYANPEVIAQC